MLDGQPLGRTLEAVLVASLATIEPLLARTTRGENARLLNVLYHYSRGIDARLERVGSGSADVRALARESRRWARGLYLLALVDLGRIGIDPSENAPVAMRAYDLWWETQALADDELARGALLVEPHLLVRVGRRARLFRAAGWCIDDASGMHLPATAPCAQAIDGARAACALWSEVLAATCEGDLRRAA